MQVVDHKELKNLPSYCGKVEAVKPSVSVKQSAYPCFQPGWKNTASSSAVAYELQKLSSDEYSYSFNEVTGGVNIVLTQKSSGKEKEFFLAGSREISQLRNHMHSLTDDLCGQWFSTKGHKITKKNG